MWNPRAWTPIIRVMANGREVQGAFYKRLIKATITDEEGQAADTCTLDFDDRGNTIALPTAGDKLTVELGFKETGIGLIGEFILERWDVTGDEDGERITLQAKGADLRTKLKNAGSEEFEGKTFGEIARTVAGRDGFDVKIDDAMAKIVIPYKARVDQSEIDFLTRLADEHGGVVKPVGTKLVITKRDGGKSAGGTDLTPILINKRDCRDWAIGSEPRPRYGRVSASWTDPESGKRKLEQAETGFDGPAQIVKQHFATKDQAQAAADAEATRLTRNTGDGHFSFYGDPTARATAPVQAIGFRDGVAGAWRASKVSHVFDESGYLTTVEVKAPEKGKKS